MTDSDKDEPGKEPVSPLPPIEYDRAFFLSLAGRGRDKWNAWRRDPANAGKPVTFAGVDFGEAPWDAIDFSGFVFGDDADFSGCKWRGVAWSEIRLAPTVFKAGRASFTRATFGKQANFTGATFGNWANFTDVSFSAWTNFVGTTFGNTAIFTGAAFGYWTNFAGATFGNEAIFVGATFGDGATFTGATFGNGACFINTLFKGQADFSAKSVDQWTRDFDARDADDEKKDVLMRLKQRHKDLWASDGSGPDRFLAISFSRARFCGDADFSRRAFDEPADFTDVRFYRPPNLEGISKAERIDFTGAQIRFVPPRRPHWTFRSVSALRLRALRKIAEETKNHDLERDLYIEERKAERGIYLARRFRDYKKEPAKRWALFSHVLWIAVMALYWALADFGRSFIRPIAWLVASWAFFRWRYEDLFTPLLQKLRAMGDLKTAQIPQYHDAVHMLALGHAVPLVGAFTIDSNVRRFLFCGNATHCALVPPAGYQGLVIAQNLISILLVFFAGLALRNYFKIK